VADIMVDVQYHPQRRQYTNSLFRRVLWTVATISKVILWHWGVDHPLQTSEQVSFVTSVSTNVVETILLRHVDDRDRGTGSISVDELSDLGRSRGLANEIEIITHAPDKAEITVKFKSSFDVARSCLNPFLVGRLSGPFLVHSSRWEKVMFGNSRNQRSTHYFGEEGKDFDRELIVDAMIWKYQVPVSGVYFVEIDGILCNDFLFETDYKDKCLEDSNNFRITHVNASINAISLSTQFIGEERNLSPGYWAWSPQNLNSSLGTETFGPSRGNIPNFQPLLTRYQPIGCRFNNDERCNTALSLKRFDPYEFFFFERNVPSRLFSDSHKMVNMELKEDEIKSRVHLMKNADASKYCFVGSSHARILYWASEAYLKKWNATNIIVDYIDAKFPRHVNDELIKRNIIESNCTKSIISVGQWAAAHVPRNRKFMNLIGISPIRFPHYFLEVLNMMRSLKALNATGVHFRSIHQNTLGDVNFDCPPTDWRTPPVLDRFTDIIHNLSDVYNFPFIDTDFIAGPMWDSNHDLMHHATDGKVTKTEALFIIERLLVEDGY